MVEYVPLHKLKKVVDMSHKDENLNFGAVLIEVYDDAVKELTTNKKRYNLEIWCRGVLVLEMSLNNEIKVWNTSRHRSTIIFKLEENDNEYTFHMVSLNDLTDETKIPDMKTVNLDEYVKYYKLKDWTNEITVAMIGNMNVHLDKNDVFYMTSVEKIYAVKLPLTEEEAGQCDENGIFNLNLA